MDFATISSSASREGTKDSYVFDWNPSKNTIFLAENLHSVQINFEKPVTFMKYALQVNNKTRYMTGWNFEASYDKNKFTIIDQNSENFCPKSWAHDNVIDCDGTTARVFNVPITTARSIKITMTKPDNCNPCLIELSFFDIFMTSPRYNYLCEYIH